MSPENILPWHCLFHVFTISCTTSGTNVILLNDILIRASKLLLSNGLCLLVRVKFIFQKPLSTTASDIGTNTNSFNK